MADQSQTSKTSWLCDGLLLLCSKINFEDSQGQQQQKSE
jgi:hypothetical protein